MIEIDNEDRGCGFYFKGIGCAVGDAAGDFIIRITTEDNQARIGFSIIEAKRLLSTLRSKGGSRFDEETTPFKTRLGIKPTGWAKVQTKPNGDVEFSGIEAFQGVFEMEGDEPVFKHSDAMLGLCKVTVKEGDVALLSDAIARLIDTRPASVDQITQLFSDEMDFLDDVNALFDRGRFLEGTDLFYTRSKTFYADRKAAREAAYADMTAEELEANRAARHRIVAEIVNEFRRPLI